MQLSILLASVLGDLDRLKKNLASTKTPQIRSNEVRGHLKAVSVAWFESYRVHLGSGLDSELMPVDGGYRALLSASETAPSTSRVRDIVKKLRADIVRLRTDLISSPKGNITSDVPPSFNAIPDPVMRQILARRWAECITCLNSGAPLAATVMMGGLLESLFLARVNREANKKGIFTSSSAPKDSKTGNPLTLKDWTLNDYIAVGHELGWITQASREVSQVLRDYRNYIHPQKELAHQLSLSIPDAKMFWAVSKAIAIQLI
jgi:hypothetical protein